MLLYKYVDELSGLKILENLSIKITPPNELNDPFEFCPIPDKNSWKYSGTEPLEYPVGCLGLSSLELKKLIAEEIASKPGESPMDRIEEQFSITWYTNELKKDRLFFEKKFQGIVDRISDDYGVSCFSKVKDNILLWSHYASNHQGLCIGFDSYLLSQYVTSIAKNRGAVFEVGYLDERLKMPYDFDYAPYGPVWKHVLPFASGKSKVWEYEQEVRLLISFDFCERMLINDTKEPLAKR